MQRNVGRLHVCADIATCRLLGAEMIGPTPSTSPAGWAIQAQFTVAQCSLPFYHPVVEEGLRTPRSATPAQSSPRRWP
jgi:pyruvate/2-oxoglutarate dehydrogenase complex dihydrolipoamide dehydrogenase (E3) component